MAILKSTGFHPSSTGCHTQMIPGIKRIEEDSLYDQILLTGWQGTEVFSVPNLILIEEKS